MCVGGGGTRVSEFSLQRFFYLGGGRLFLFFFLGDGRGWGEEGLE